MHSEESPGSLSIVVGSVLVGLGFFGGAGLLLSMLISAFGDVAFVDPAERSRVLSQGIRDAMTYGLCSGGSVVGVGAILIGIGVRRRRARPRPAP